MEYKYGKRRKDCKERCRSQGDRWSRSISPTAKAIGGQGTVTPQANANLHCICTPDSHKPL